MNVRNFKNKLVELYEDLENFLIQHIDSADEEIADDKAMENYMMSVFPDEYSTYCFIRDILEKK